MTDTAPDDFPFPTTERHEPLAKPVATPEKDPEEHALDQGVAESFPASDPVSVSVTKINDSGEETGAKKDE